MEMSYMKEKIIKTNEIRKWEAKEMDVEKWEAIVKANRKTWRKSCPRNREIQDQGPQI